MNLFLNFLLNRITQLAIRVLTIVFAFLFGQEAVASPDAVAAIEQGAGWLLAGALSLGLDLLIHSALWGKLQQWVKDHTGGSGGTGGGISPAAMLLALGLLTAALHGTALLTGCAQNETNRAAQALIAVQSHAKSLDALVNSDSLTEAQARSLQKALHAEQDAAAAYYEAIRSGSPEQLALAKAALAAASRSASEAFAQYIVPVTPMTLPAVPATTRGN